MAEKKKIKASTEDSDTEEGRGARRKSAKKSLLAAIALCAFSLGGGFFLARMAYLEDSAAFDAEVDEKAGGHGDDYASGDEHGGNDDKKSNGSYVDPLAKDGHPAGEAKALKADSGAKISNGLLEFGEMLTNIQRVDEVGATSRAFLKVNIVMAYRTEEGASDLIKMREPFIRDLFNGYLRGLHEADVRGMAGVLNVKAELLKRARAAVGNDLPQEILIKDLIVQ